MLAQIHRNVKGNETFISVLLQLGANPETKRYLLRAVMVIVSQAMHLLIIEQEFLRLIALGALSQRRTVPITRCARSVGRIVFAVAQPHGESRGGIIA
jgi:hypothetical protein